MRPEWQQALPGNLANPVRQMNKVAHIHANGQIKVVESRTRANINPLKSLDQPVTLAAQATQRRPTGPVLWGQAALKVTQIRAA